jgi:predicted small integral membrane protein
MASARVLRIFHHATPAATRRAAFADRPLDRHHGTGIMIITRISKIAMIAALAAFALIVAYDNITDYGSNYEFVKHVLSMDTTFAGNALRSRAITNETVWHAAYAVIIAAEAATGLLLAFATLVLLYRLNSPAAIFNRAKVIAVAGLALGFGLWFFGFLVVAGEYFAMWQSKIWNGQEAAFRITAVILGVLIFVRMPDDEMS